MSLIQLSSKGSITNDNNNFTCYFNRGIEIKANAKIGLVSATLQHKKEDLAIITESNNTFFMRFGYNPHLHRTIKVEIPVGKYTYEKLTQRMELEISKKQNFLRFKTLTHLNNPLLSNKWLQFGTKIYPTVNEIGELTAIDFVNFQVPSSNVGIYENVEGELLLENGFKSLPLLTKRTSFTKIIPNHFLYDEKIKYNVIEAHKDGEVTTKLSLNNLANAVNNGTEREEGIPVIIKEYISYDTDFNVVFSLKKPTGGSWNVETARFVGLVSYGDIMEEKTKGLMSFMETLEGGEIESPPCKVGVQFHQGVAEVLCLGKLPNEEQEMNEGVEISQFGLEASGISLHQLEDGVDEYFIRFYVGYEADGEVLRSGNQFKIEMSEDIDFETLILDVLTDSKKVFMGTKAFPLVPIMINNNEEDDDEEASKIYIHASTQEDGTDFAYTHANILDSECEVSYPSDIPYNPEKVYPINKNATDSIEYTTVDTDGLAVRLWDYSDSLFIYLNGESGQLLEPYTRTINDLVNDRDLKIEQLHPTQEATIGPIIGINTRFNLFDNETEGLILGSYYFQLTTLDVYADYNNPSYHIQLNNLPVKALNSINHSITPTIAVISKVNVNKESTSITPNEIQFININNKEKMVINELSVRITNDDNTLTEDLEGTVELICLIKD
tara:strand:- start:1649 stop:3652 length:2004 start_codon:yes stop_codon:yes gene_type:complete